jgi:hypothetical protein
LRQSDQNAVVGVRRTVSLQELSAFMMHPGVAVTFYPFFRQIESATVPQPAVQNDGLSEP